MHTTTANALGLPDHTARMKACAELKLAALTEIKRTIAAWELLLIDRAMTGRFYTDEDQAELDYLNALAGLMESDRTLESLIEDLEYDMGGPSRADMIANAQFDHYKDV